MGEGSPPARGASHPPGRQCDICGLSREEAMGFLIDCKLNRCAACVRCCSLVGGPYADACRECTWGAQFWKDGKAPRPALAAEDAVLTYA